MSMRPQAKAEDGRRQRTPCRWIIDGEGKLFLIVDNLRVHHAVKVRQWVSEHHGAIELLFLPAYAPDHNPDEYLNNDLKQQLKNLPNTSSC